MLRLKIGNILTTPRTPMLEGTPEPRVTASPSPAARPLASPPPSPQNVLPEGLQAPESEQPRRAAPSRKRRAPEHEAPKSRAQRQRTACATPPNQSLTAAASPPPSPSWFTRFPSAPSVWDTARAACGHTPADDAWALTVLAGQHQPAQALGDIHAMMAHLAGAMDCAHNVKLFRILVQWPEAVRSSAAEALLKAFASPAAASSCARVTLAQKACFADAPNAMHALQCLTHFEALTNKSTYQRLLMFLRRATEFQRREILPVLLPYCDTNVDPSGQNALFLLQNRLTATDASSASTFCQFLSECHGLAPHTAQPFTKSDVESAALIAVHERAEFLMSLRALGITGDADETSSHFGDDYIAPLAHIPAPLRAAATAATLNVYWDTRNASACMHARRTSLVFLSQPSVQSFISQLHDTSRSDRDIQVLYRGISQALLTVSPNRRHTALMVTQMLVPENIGDPQTIIDHLILLDNLARFERVVADVSEQTLLDAASRTRKLLQPLRNIRETLTTFFALAECSQSEREHVCCLVERVLAGDTQQPCRDALVTEAICLGSDLRRHVLDVMQPYAFSAEHDPQTTYKVFLALAHIHRHGFAYDIKAAIKSWAEHSGFADIPNCAALCVFSGLRQLIRTHQDRGSQPSFSAQTPSQSDSNQEDAAAFDSLTTPTSDFSLDTAPLKCSPPWVWNWTARPISGGAYCLWPECHAALCSERHRPGCQLD